MACVLLQAVQKTICPAEHTTKRPFCHPSFWVPDPRIQLYTMWSKTCFDVSCFYEILNTCHAYHTPPKGIGKRGEIVIATLFEHVYHEWGEDQAQKANVQCGDKLLECSLAVTSQSFPSFSIQYLSVGPNNTAQQLPGAATSIYANHA